MSTAKVREALARLRGWGDVDVADAAEFEVEAIEKAAQVIERHFEVPPEAAARPECLDARLLMRAIAQESK